MRLLLNNILRPLITAGLAIVLGNNSTSGCMPIAEPTSPLDGLYIQETRKCVEVSKTLEESRQCRANVNYRFGLCPSSDMTILCPWGLP